MQRRPSVAPPRLVDATFAAVATDDPFAVHLAAPVQRRPGAVGDQADDGAVHAAAVHGTSGAAGPLPHLDAIQRAFGSHDVSHVRAHTGPQAAAGAAAMGAEAFATGDAVAFAGPPSLHTAAHEAAHVVQQQAGVHLAGGVGREGDRFERHADAVADRVVAGASAADLLDEVAGGARPDGAVQRAVQRVPEKDERGAKKSIDKDYEPPLLLEDTETKDAYKLEGLPLTIHFKATKQYFRDKDHKIALDVEAYRKTSIDEFKDWKSTFEQVSGATHDMDEGSLKRALSLHALQMFTCNALFEAEEVTRFHYQTTPLTFAQGGSYLRSHASSFVNALKSTFKTYQPDELFALRNLDFQDVLGQMMERIAVDSSTSKEQTVELEKSLTPTIERMVRYALDNGPGGLKGYDSNHPVTFLDFTASLKVLAEQGSDQIPKVGKELAELINKTALDQAKEILIDRFVDDLYQGEVGGEEGGRELEKTEVKKEVRQLLDKPKTNVLHLHALLNRKAKPRFEQEKREKRQALEGKLVHVVEQVEGHEGEQVVEDKQDEQVVEQVEGNKGGMVVEQVEGHEGEQVVEDKRDEQVEGNEGEQVVEGKKEDPTETLFKAHKPNLDGYLKWLQGAGADHAVEGDERTLIDDKPKRRATFCRLVAVPDGSYQAYLRAAIQANDETAYKDKKFSEKELGTALAPLKKLMAGFDKGLPQLIMSGGTLTLDKQPVLFVPSLDKETAKETTKSIDHVLNKAGYNPTPTSVIDKMLDKKLTVQDIAISTLEQQIRFEQGHYQVTDKLELLLQELRGFDPSKHVEVDDVEVELERVQKTLKEFAGLATSDTSYLSLLAGSTAKLVEELGLVNEGFPMLGQLAKSLAAAVEGQQDIVRFTREIQRIHELILFALARNPELGKSEQLELGVSTENLQGARITDYGLKAFAEAYNAFRSQTSGESIQIDAYYNIYFELTHKLEATRISGGGKVTTTAPKTVGETPYVEAHEQEGKDDHKDEEVKHDDEVEQDKKEVQLEVEKVDVQDGTTVEVKRPDLVLIDIHPNDAARREMHANDVLRLLAALFPKDGKNRCTVMVDVTLNHITEAEVEEIRSKNAELISEGRLNLVLVQSLTKFAQMGTDKLSGGLVLHYNNDKDWKAFNESMAKSQKEDVVDSTIERYFQLLFKHTKDQQLLYLTKIRENTTYLYGALKKQLERLKVPPDEQAISLALSDDPKSCYVALHYEEFAAKLFGEERTDDQVEKLNHDVLHEGIVKLMAKLDLPPSMRQSFGFPISNFGDTGKTIRLTLGVEPIELLDKYVKVLTYVNATVSSASATVMKNQPIENETGRAKFFEDLTGSIKDIGDLEDKLAPMFKVEEN